VENAVCAKTIVKESHKFELAHLKKKRRRKRRRRRKKDKTFWPSGDFLAQYFCDAF